MSWLTNPVARLRAMGMAMLCVTFVVGGLVGAAARQVVIAREPGGDGIPAQACVHDDRDGRTPDDDERRPPLYEQLDLTDEQRVQIDEILAASTSRIDALEPRMRAIVDSTRAEIYGLLTSAQRDELRQLVAERRARRDAERDSAKAREQTPREESPS